MGGGGGSSKETAQQRELQTQQALTTANLNLEENSQRKSILNAMLGTRVFAGSALSRAVAGNTPGVGGVAAGPAPSASQNSEGIVSGGVHSLLDTQAAAASGAGGAGGTGASASSAAITSRNGSYAGGGGSRSGSANAR